MEKEIELWKPKHDIPNSSKAVQPEGVVARNNSSMIQTEAQRASLVSPLINDADHQIVIFEGQEGMNVVLENGTNFGAQIDESSINEHIGRVESGNCPKLIVIKLLGWMMIE